jgi:hypothetical protein
MAADTDTGSERVVLVFQASNDGCDFFSVQNNNKVMAKPDTNLNLKPLMKKHMFLTIKPTQKNTMQ